jgi:hypothetical protein
MHLFTRVMLESLAINDLQALARYVQISRSAKALVAHHFEAEQ